jgi:hypothetical protein
MRISFFLEITNIKMTANGKDQGEWYTADCGRTQFTLPVRYQDLVPIGQGTKGIVM